MFEIQTRKPGGKAFRTVKSKRSFAEAAFYLSRHANGTDARIVTRPNGKIKSLIERIRVVEA